MKKRILSALCAVMLLVSAVPMASAQSGDTARRGRRVDGAAPAV